MGGAYAVRQQERIGSLETGKKADLIVVDTQSVHLVPTQRIVSAWPHNGQPGEAESVMVDGAFLMRDRKVLTMDEDALIKEADAIGRRAWNPFLDRYPTAPFPTRMAPPGGIWVAEPTYRVARDAFDWQALGPQEVKGKAEPVAVYGLRGRRDVHGRFDVLARRGLTPLVGRESARQHLMEVWAQARHGQGRVLSIVGEAGLGKSRLLYEFKQQLRQQGVRCVEGTCFTYGESISYLPFLDVVQTLCDLAPNRTEGEAKQQIASHLTTLGLKPSAIAPYLHNLLSFTVEDDMFPKLTPELFDAARLWP